MTIILGGALLGPGVLSVKSKAMNQPTDRASSDSVIEYQSDVVAATDSPTILAGGSASTTLKSATGPNAQSLSTRIGALVPGKSFYLLLKDLSVKVQPGTLYRIYVDLPADAKPVRDDPHYVGMLNFYSAGTSGDLRPPDTGNSPFLRYDITTVLKNLKAQNLLCDETIITIIPTATPAAGSDARIGRIEIVE